MVSSLSLQHLFCVIFNMFPNVLHLAEFFPTGLQPHIAPRFTKVRAAQVGYLLFVPFVIPEAGFAQLPRQHSPSEPQLGLGKLFVALPVRLCCHPLAVSVCSAFYSKAGCMWLILHRKTTYYYYLLPISYKHIIAITVIPHDSTKLNKN